MKAFKVDSFTSEPFSGNPAGVCILEDFRDEQWMQNIAQEMSLPETAFIGKENGEFNIRWFTPKAEVDLCGHATLAAAHILWEENVAEEHEEIRFKTRKSGILNAEKDGEWIKLDFPAEVQSECDIPKGMVEALGITPRYFGKNRFDYLIEIESEEALVNLSPNFKELSKFPIRGIIVTSRTLRKEYDFASRFFAPAIGIDEDPVTGSAHCCLGPYWESRLNKKKLLGYQASDRGGFVGVECNNDRVTLAGRAITILRGEIIV